MILSKNEKKTIGKIIEQNILSYFISFEITSTKKNGTWNGSKVHILGLHGSLGIRRKPQSYITVNIFSVLEPAQLYVCGTW